MAPTIGRKPEKRASRRVGNLEFATGHRQSF
jgi:hypothetical protein